MTVHVKTQKNPSRLSEHPQRHQRRIDFSAPLHPFFFCVGREQMSANQNQITNQSILWQTLPYDSLSPVANSRQRILILRSRLPLPLQKNRLRSRANVPLDKPYFLRCATVQIYRINRWLKMFAPQQNLFASARKQLTSFFSSSGYFQ